MRKSGSIQVMTVSALLIAIGIVIPMFSPLKVVLEPASFTLASHVAIFLSMFISPFAAIAVTLGTTLGFLLGGFPIVVVLRAASHIFFTVIGSIILHKRPSVVQGAAKAQVFSFFIGLIHAVGEVAVVSAFYFGSSVLSSGYYTNGFISSVLGLVGIGSVVHSMVDFAIALLILKVFANQRGFSDVFSCNPYDGYSAAKRLKCL
ncbi:hypothetical protein U6B65_04680 [Oscillospiraceae bacterium MB08-C2-2]|nr:hypothetical protein U6B65_04680 [Oscillospiraceae bacterium MB08-C2-2]